MDPISAVGGNMLTQYMQAEAERKEKEKQMRVNAEQQLGVDQQKAMGDILNYYRQALG